MYIVNKIVGYLISPAGFGMALVGAAVVARTMGRKRLAGWAVVLAFANLWLWSTPWMTAKVGAPLEAEFLVGGRVPAVEALPHADAIALHGGGMGIATNIGSRAEMWTSADRVWHAARLWKAGKAPKILVMGRGGVDSTQDLLLDFGISTNALVFTDEPRNTEEEAKAIVRLFDCSDCPIGEGRPRVLVVTSAWHMKRTMLMYEKYARGVEAVPAPCDFENTLGAEKTKGLMCLLPDPQALVGNSIAVHEWLGYFGYKWLR